MREHGRIQSARGLGAAGHACWAFDGLEQFHTAALDFLEDGLRFGQRIAYVGSEPVDEQREVLDPLGDVGTLIDQGALQLFALPDLYDVGQPIDSEAQLATYSQATQVALTDGFSGLRVAAQATDLVTDPSTWEAHVRWESVADRFMASNPLSALCCYDGEALPDELLGDLAAVHPASCHEDAQLAPFHVFADPEGVVLEGEVDMFSAGSLERLLEVAWDEEAPDRLDLGALDFIDHHGLFALVAHIERRRPGREASVRDVPPTVERLCELLEVKL
jgi:anti-anti-sigma regulatory factor